LIGDRDELRAIELGPVETPTFAYRLHGDNRDLTITGWLQRYPVLIPVYDAAYGKEGWLLLHLDPTNATPQIRLSVEVSQDTTIEALIHVWNKIIEWRARIQAYNAEMRRITQSKLNAQGTTFDFLKGKKSYREIAEMIERDLRVLIQEAAAQTSQIASEHYWGVVMDTLLEIGYSRKRAEDLVRQFMQNLEEGESPFQPGEVIDAIKVREKIRYRQRKKKKGVGKT